METASKFRHALYGVTNLTLFLAGVASLVAGIIAAFGGSTAMTATALAAGLVLLLAATIDRFESLKGLGIEAKTRQLDNKIEEADEALRRLREVTQLTCSVLVDQTSKIGRFASPKTRELFGIAGRFRPILRDIGSDQATIEAILTPWAKVLCFDMARAQTEELDKLASKRLQQLQVQRSDLRSPIEPNNAEFAELTRRMQVLQDFQTRRSKMHLLNLEDFPDKFMELFDQVPELDAGEVATLRDRAARFANGMRSLAKDRTLPEMEEWIAELERTRGR